MRKIILLIVLCVISMNMFAQSYSRLWKQVADAESKDLPQSAIKLMDDIFQKAIKDKNSGEMLYAYTRKAEKQQEITPDSFYVNITDLENWVESPAINHLDRAVIHSILAGMYSNYASQNQWQLRQRTNVIEEMPSADMREWSGNMFVQKVITHSRMALADSLLLLNASTKDFKPFVVQSAGSEYYRHDMYHLLALQSAQSLNNVIPLQTDSLVTKAVDALYGKLIDTYRQRNNSEALYLSTLERLNWKKRQISRNEYRETIDELISGFSTNPLVVEAYLLKARDLKDNGENVRALEILDDVIAEFPKYKRVNALRNLREEILRPQLNVSVNSMAYPGDEISLNVDHKNLKGFTVNLYTVNLPVTSKALKEPVDDEFIKKHAGRHSAKHYDLELSAKYFSADTVIKMEVPGIGLYLMEIVPDIRSESNRSYLLSVTQLSILSRKMPGNMFEMIVLDAKTGKPVSDARVCLYADKKGDKVQVNSLVTNTDGKINIPWRDEYRYMTADKDNDTSMLMQYVHNGYYSFRTPQSSNMVTLLTDRAIYRPGQTVYVKGIAYAQKEDAADVIAGRSYTLSLYDASSGEINKKEVRTNEFGSFTAEFVLPSGGLNGIYTIRTENGRRSIQVEEYKRPTFDITFNKQEKSYSLYDAIQVKGNVKTYSGVVVQNVPVTYTVNRSARGWWRGFLGPDVLIASGEVALNDAGEFSIPVTLGPDDNYKNEGYFVYTVEASVTNIAGETQSSRTIIAAGTRSILLSSDIDSPVNKDDSIKMTFTATNLNNQPVSVTGEYKFYPITDYKKKTIATQAAYTGTFTSNVEMSPDGVGKLPSGAYKVVVTAKDDKGRQSDYETETVLFSAEDTRPPVESEIWFYPVNTEFDNSQSASFVFGTSLADAYILMDVFSGDKLVESRVLNLTDTLIRFEYPYKEEYGNGLAVFFSLMRNNSLYRQDVRLTKKIPDKELKMKWEVFRDKLRPGQKEEWKLTIKDPRDTPVDAEMLASLYDASLDKLWRADQMLKLYYSRSLPYTSWNMYHTGTNNYILRFAGKAYKYESLVFDRFWNNYTMITDYYRYENLEVAYGTRVRGVNAGGITMARPKMAADMVMEAGDDLSESVGQADAPEESLSEGGQELRANFAETAFFYPQLRTNEKGEIVILFTMPESLTRWKFRGYAHTKDMLTGYLEGETVTAKEFMLAPNLPRFVRVGDKTSIAASVANLTGKALSGTVVLTLFDPVTEKVISTQKQKFDAEAGKTTAVDFMFTATDKYDVLGCRLVAESGSFSDGEQHLLPVLSNKENMIETIAIPIRGNEKREFSLESLFNNNSATATDRKLTVEFSGNPAWYAIQALPTMSLPINDNAISWAASYYVNSLASYITDTHPRIKTMFDTWKAKGGTKESFMSNLQKNEDVKNILLEESPWLMEATSEAEQMQRVATLFDLNNIRNNNITALNKLKDLQLNSGGWTWYKGMSESSYITSYVVEVLARLENLTGRPLSGDALSMRRNAFNYLHREAQKEYKQIREAGKNGTAVKGITSSALNYLYLVAISDVNVPDANKPVQKYFMDKLNESVASLSITDKAHAAVVLNKARRTNDAKAFIASIREYSVTTDEQGMHFAFNESPYTWSGLRIPAHVAVMEALDVVANDKPAVEEMKLWLLKQKQTQQWNSPVSTVDAIYALLNRGGDILESHGDVRITIGGKTIETLNPDNKSIPGISYVKEIISDKTTIDKAKKVTVEKQDAGIAWGAVYAQYREDIDKVRQHGAELNADKKLYVEKLAGAKKELLPVTADTQLKVGDKVISRITIRLDRAMDFVQLKDRRGSCFEPAGTISGYHWNGGIGYYIDIKDASTNFFFDSLGKGVYVLEYSYRVARAGEYAGGTAVIQSAYAPEYESHSASVMVTVL